MKRAFLIAAICLGAAAPTQIQAQDYTVVVNSANPVATLSKSQISGFFLRQSAKWSDGKAVTPVDLGKASKVRETFTKTVHGRSVSAVASFWQQQIFAGKDVPPPEKESDADVLAFVRSNPGAIGYVAAGTTLGDNVKAVPVK